MRIKEQVEIYLVLRLTEEISALTRDEMENFIKENLENLGGWQVKEVRQLDLPDAERKIKLKHKIQQKEGDEERIKTVEVDGEVQKFRVTVVGTSATYKVWPHKGTLLFGGIPLGDENPPGEMVYKVSRYGVMFVGAPVIMLLACIITSFYIPNMLRKGTIDLLLAKPISRVSLMLYKYTGGLTFMFITTTMLIVGLWVALGLRSGVWEPVFLMTIPILTFEFALFYALSTLAAVLTRSPIVSILLCVVAWGFLWGVAGWAHYFASATKGPGKDDEGMLPKWVYSTGDILHAVAPHYLDLDWLGDRMLLERSEAMTTVEREVLAKKYEQYGWWESILVTAAYIVLFLGLACWRFAAKDY
jgi:ABC-type transport system involved in multi-copper enzyme maturation permease subunit